jgi:DNA-directed RNA polymerase specialized sigma24 family protein
MAGMAKHPDASAHRESFRRLNQIRHEAIEHYRLAQQLHRDRRELIRRLLDEGFSQADIAREMGVSRQAVQKMLR